MEKRTLHEAIKEVLILNGGGLNVREIAERINKYNLYKRNDGAPVPTSQIHARINKYLNIFEKVGDKVLIKDLNNSDILIEQAWLILLQIIEGYLMKLPSITLIELQKLIFVLIIQYDRVSNKEINEEFKNEVKGILGANTLFDVNQQNENLWLKFLNKICSTKDRLHNIRLLNDKLLKAQFMNDSSPILPAFFDKFIHASNFIGKNTSLLTYNISLNSYLLYALDKENITELNIKHLKRWDYASNINELMFKSCLIDIEKTDLHNKSVAILTPPFNDKVGKLESNYSSNFSFIEELSIEKNAPNASKAIIVVPQSALFSINRKDIIGRELLFKKRAIKSVFTIQSHSKYKAAINLAILYLDFEVPQNQIYFADFTTDNKKDYLLDWRKINEYILQQKVENKISSIVEYENASSNYNLLPSRYVFKTEIEVASGYELLPLKKVILKYHRGNIINKSSLHEKGEIKFISTRSLNNYGGLLNDESIEIGIDKDELKQNITLTNNSIVGSLIGDNFKPTLVNSRKTFIIDNKLVELIPDPDQVDSEYLVNELNQEYVKNQLNQIRYGMAIKTLKVQDLLEIKVQIPISDNFVTEEPQTYYKNNKSQEVHDYVATLKHTIKQHLKTLSSDFSSLEKYLLKKSDNKSHIDLNEIIVPHLVDENNEDLKPYQLQETLRRINNAIASSHNIIEKAQDALTINKLKRDWFSLNELMEEIELQNPKISFKIKKSKDDTIYADRILIKMAINNIVENAFKHGISKDKAKKLSVFISIEFNSDNEEFYIDIANDGIPLPEEFVIDEFTSNGGKNGSRQGTGFGGYLINEILKKHNGKISFLEKDKLLGLSFNVFFTITLPKY